MCPQMVLCSNGSLPYEKVVPAAGALLHKATAAAVAEMAWGHKSL